MTRMIALFTIAALAAAIAVFRLPGGPTPAYAIDCGDYPYQQFAQLFLRIDPTDRNGLDGPNDNGIACEELPCPCDYEPVTEAIGDYEPTPVIGSAAATATTAAVTSGAAATATAMAPTAAAPTATQPVVIVVPTSTPAATLSTITPPSTGDAGLR